MTPSALLLLCLPWLAAAKFTFTSTAPTQCDDVQITWTGGSGAGYYLSLIPIFGVPRNISIPSTDVDGTFSTVMPLNVSDQVVLTLSDATGFGSGGSTEILKVGPPTGESCNLTAPDLPFTFGPDSAPVQCQPFTFIDFDAAIPPVTVIGVIPGGDSFLLNVPPAAKQFEWTANVFNGTTIILMMVDAQGRTGGSVRTTVGLSSDSSCINDRSPSSTIPPSSGPTSGSSSPSPSSTVPSTPSSNVGAIAGSVLGALIFLAVLITLGLFFLRQRQEKKNARIAGGNEFRRSRPLNPSELDLTYDPQRNLNSSPFMSTSATPTASTFNQVPPAHYVPHSRYLGSGLPESENPFNSPVQSSSHNTHNTDVDPFMERESDATSAGQRKSGMAGFTAYKPSRYVVHTDAEDDDIAPNEDGIIELPPQYSASRGPPRSNTFNAPPL